MKEFMLLVRVPVTYTSEQAKAINPAWELVVAQWKADNNFVSSYVFPGESFVLTGTNRQVKNRAVLSDNRKLVSSIILRTTSLAAAVELAKVCPVLNHAGSVEIREIPPR